MQAERDKTIFARIVAPKKWLTFGNKVIILSLIQKLF